MHSFEYNTREALIQGLSIQAGKLFADLYTTGTAQQSQDSLEAYKSLRRLLPRDESNWGSYDRPHIGHSAAHKATQGITA